MKKRMLETLIVLAACAAFAAPAVAGERILTLDPETTEIAFSVPATGHDVHGAFQLESGEIRFDPETGTATGKIEVDAQGAKTGNKSRDKKMHGKVLESETFPRFTFTPERFDGRIGESGASEIQVHGSFDVHGGSHPMTLPMTVTIDGDRLSVDTTFGIPYVEWGMDNPSLLFLRVAKVVEVKVSAQGSLSDVGVARNAIGN